MEILMKSEKIQMLSKNTLSQSSFVSLDRLREHLKKEERQLMNAWFPWEFSVVDITTLCSDNSFVNLRTERDALVRWITEVFWDRPTAFCSLTFPDRPSLETVQHTAQIYLDRVIQKLPSSYTDNPRRIVFIHTSPKNHIHMLFELPKNTSDALYVRVMLADLWIQVVTDIGKSRGRKIPMSAISVLADVDVVPNTADGVDMSHQQEMRRIVAQYCQRNFIAEEGTTAVIHSDHERRRGKFTSAPCVLTV